MNDSELKLFVACLSCLSSCSLSLNSLKFQTTVLAFVVSKSLHFRVNIPFWNEFITLAQKLGTNFEQISYSILWGLHLGNQQNLFKPKSATDFEFAFKHSHSLSSV